MGRPPGATGNQTRNQILDFALEAFAELGFEAMSVRELTRKLGVSHNLVHHHFGSKLDLWRAALDHGVGPTADALLARVRESVGQPNPVEVVRESMQRAIELLGQRPSIARIIADESARPGPRLDYIYDRYLKPGLGILQRFLKGARDQGVRDIDSRVAVLFVLSAASAPITHGALAQKLGLGAAANPALADLALHGLAQPVKAN